MLPELVTTTAVVNVLVVALLIGISQAFRLPGVPLSAVDNGRTTGACCSTTRLRSSTSETPAVAAQEEGSKREENLFDWNKQWYPVLAVDHTDPGRSHAVQLLGKDLVVWRNKEGRWTCFDDRCPHRAAPLTEGRIDEKDGNLMCAYHAWRFDADGKCLTIPQSDRGGRDEAQKAACAKVYPTKVAQDMVWVWGENSPDAGLESALTNPTLVPALDDVEGIRSGRIVVGPTSQRDLPYGWDTWVENVVDPSHVVVAHHGLMGSRDMAAPVVLEILHPGITKKGFTVHNSSPKFGARKSVQDFVAPSLVDISTENADGTTIKLVQYAVPTRPGWCRMINRPITITPKDQDLKRKLFRFQPNKLPAWMQHMLSHMFLNQDVCFLHQQEKTLASAGYDSTTWNKAVFTPSTADVGVLALRKWIAKFSSGGPQWVTGCDPALPPREHDRDALFNIYEQHTKSCTTCLRVLKRVNQGLRAAKISAVASLAWAVLRGAAAASGTVSPSASVLNPGTAKPMLPALAVMFACLGVTKVLTPLRGMFYIHKYHHQDNP